MNANSVPHSFRKLREMNGAPWLLPLFRLRRFRHTQYQGPLFIHSHQACLTIGIGAIAAPCPLIRLRNQAALYWIAMHVAQFLHALLLRPRVVVVKAAVPDLTLLKRIGPELARSYLRAEPGQYLVRKALFQDFHHYRGIASIRLGHEEMEVLRHDHVADHDETVILAGALQNLQKQTAAIRLGQERPPLITTAGDEVEVSPTVVTPEAA